MRLTLVREEHLGERRHSDQEVQHGAAVGVVWAVVVRLDGRHGVVLANALLVLLLEVLLNKHRHVLMRFLTWTSNTIKKHIHRQALPCNYPRSGPLSLSTALRWVCLNSCMTTERKQSGNEPRSTVINGNNSPIINDSCVTSLPDFRET